MNTENDNWYDNSQESDTSREGNRTYNREGYNRRDDNSKYNRPYNERSSTSRYSSEGGERPQRPRINREGERVTFDRPSRPRFTNNEGADRPYGRPRINREGGQQRSYNRYDNQQRSYNRDDNQQRSYNRDDNQQRGYNRDDNYQRGGYNRDYQQRPSWRNNQEDGARPSFRKPSTGGGGYNNSYQRGGDRPRPRYNNDTRRPGGFARPVRRDGDYDPNAKYSQRKRIEYKEQFIDPTQPIRLNKYLANAGVCSRREADEFIQAGVVSVNGEVVTELGTKVLRTDVVKFHEEPVSLEQKVYVLLNKPKDCVTTADDPQARRTVMDLVKGACEERIYPVGRLDRNTTGVLLLTNDGDLASKLTHPKFLKKKIYHVVLDKSLTKNDMDQIAAGVELDDGEIRADAISYTDDFKKNEIGIEIHSGKNRIVRRIFESLGYKVMRLDRVFFAGLTKKGLRRGDWRYLSETEVNILRMGAFE